MAKTLSTHCILYCRTPQNNSRTQTDKSNMEAYSGNSLCSFSQHCPHPRSLPSRIPIIPICVFPPSSCIYPVATVLLNALFSIVKDTGTHFLSLPPSLHIVLRCHHNSCFATAASWNRTHDEPTPRMLPLTLSTAPLITILIG